MLKQAFAFERVALTPYTSVTILLPPFFGFYVMAVLVQLPRTNFYRTALLPMVCWSSFLASVSLDFSRNDPRYVYLNQCLALSMFTIAMRSIIWALAQQPYYRIPICMADDSTTSYQNADTHILRKSGASVSSAMWNAWNLVSNLRGIGWNRPQNAYINKPSFRVESRSAFALLCFCRFTLLVLMCDILLKIIFLLGRDTFEIADGTIFNSSLPAPERYLKSSIITLLAGTIVYVAVDSSYHLYAVIFTMLFRQHPSEWPLLLDSPWLSTSLSSLWGRRWHQYFREIFVEIGGKPLERYFGKAGLVMGAFALSGLLHDIGARGMDRGVHTLPIAGFFVMQGVGVLMENAWKNITGKRVGGFIGWLWVCFWLLLWGNGLVDAWARQGFLQFEFGPEAYRPTTLFLSWIS